ncbi:hypothetical protein Ae168Ps1_4555 [Pseudonocardia sp. Ae168_Ps1]|nr:hypothetical protein Ae150APs1_4528 [Pseudonocardia sp. Ae150A_Ps1]OLL82149.1 hypothetical protein Ae168Ps1_4555 [Pseudonocardia sp. Ae168_Ps1]OLL83737.1 hypothetical protein Ae263Ps1_0792c [Pseudonocardia sp. Ae263_Ps1]OLL90223.1 hypothetical protein Ae356Ps1_0120 [Pseudonocardia sp. Ae356_Ps1]
MVRVAGRTGTRRVDAPVARGRAGGSGAAGGVTAHRCAVPPPEGSHRPPGGRTAPLDRRTAGGDRRPSAAPGGAAYQRMWWRTAPSPIRSRRA